MSDGVPSGEATPQGPDQPTVADNLLATVVQPDARPASLNELRRSLRFTPISPLDEGGMGQVLQALDTHLGRHVVVKRLHEHLADNAEQRARFFRESKIQSSLNHPGVVPLHAAGVDETGLPFIAMKQVRGRVLSEVLASRRLGDPRSVAEFSRRRLLRDFAKLCWTVAFAHSKHVVHRDIKPANVMLGELGEVYLLDWGIATWSGAADTGLGPSSSADRDDPAATAPAGLTDPHGALGTPAYMSPEHARGGAFVVPASDVFALGAILFELLTGKRLNPGRGGSEAMLLALLPVAERARERLESSQVPDGLRALVLGATHFDIEERPTAAQLAESVERLVSVEGQRKERQRRARRYERQAFALLDGGGEAGAMAALRILNRADALAPAHSKAAELLAELVSQADTLGLHGSSVGLQARLQQHRQKGITSSVLIMIPAAITLATLTWLAGGPRWSLVPTLVGTSLLTTLLVYAQRRGSVPSWHYTVSGLVGGSAAASLCVVGGPLVLVPVCVLAHFALLLTNARADAKVRFRQAVLAVSCVLVPFLLQLVGVLPTSYVFEGGGMRIRPIGFELSGVALWGFVGVASALLMSLTVLALARSARSLTQAERKLFAQRWILGSMLKRP